MPLENMNKCIKSYYKQDRFKTGAKLFDTDLYFVSKHDSYNKVNDIMCIRKDIGEMEMHVGELNW